FLLTDLSGTYVDGTLGGCGHSQAILGRLSGGRLIGIDRDPAAIQRARMKLASCGELKTPAASGGESSIFKENDFYFRPLTPGQAPGNALAVRFTAVQGTLGRIDEHLNALGIREIDGLLLDLGVSSHQIDTSDRGFSYMRDGRLDMRMDPSSGWTAGDLVNTCEESELAGMLMTFGGERNARRLSRAIVRARSRRRLESTSDLAAVVADAVSPRWRIKTLSRVFQALRIAVNGEMDELRDCLIRSYPFVKEGGRYSIIAYHSLESRMVKRFFQGQDPTYVPGETTDAPKKYHFHILTRHGVQPSSAEMERNSRASSALLRAAEKKEQGAAA
ncbi:16S rRNA (cytosine(1402)-N(4))-methyltransferase RsmH, partial [bacterium]|nr:16S rRNA (cytosine(1402)-N(4))-methyltransferase RsmH [bacterium]